MARLRKLVTAFTAGILDEAYEGRSDEQSYFIGCRELDNVWVRPQGPITRRWGTRRVTELPANDKVKLIPFKFSGIEQYVIAATHLKLSIYAAFNGLLEAELVAPWTSAQLDELEWAQIGDLMILTQQDVQIRQLKRLASSWELETFLFDTLPDATDRTEQPFFSYTSGISLNPTAGSGTIDITSSAPLFDSTWIGRYIRLHSGIVKITDLNTSSSVDAEVIGVNLGSAAETYNWSEEAFNNYRGWPRTVSFHEGRLIFGGGKSAPDQVWGSKVGLIRNFTTGTAADAGFSVSTSTGRVGEIRHLSSGAGGLEIFKRDEEGIIPSGANDPITPTSVAYRVQTRNGSSLTNIEQIEDSTVYVQRTGGSIREFLFEDVNEAYESGNLTIRAPSIFKDPVALASIRDAFNIKADFLFAINDDGTAAVLNTARANGVVAWTTVTTLGTIKSACNAGELIYLAVERVPGANFQLEVLDESMMVDAGINDSSPTPTDTYGPYPWLAFATLDVLAGGEFIAQVTAAGDGTVVLPELFSAVQIGLPFRARVKTMPVEVPNSVQLGSARRVSRVITQVIDTLGVRVNGAREMFPRAEDDNLGVQPTPYNGVFKTRLLGWSDDPRVILEQTGPYPFTIVSMALDLVVN